MGWSGIGDPGQPDKVGMHRLAPADTGDFQEKIGKACAGVSAPPGQTVVVDRKRLRRKCLLIDLRKRVVAVMGEGKWRDKVTLKVDAPVRHVMRLNDAAKALKDQHVFTE